jgi:ligand-binding SRPBCC domain-containing protein
VASFELRTEIAAPLQRVFDLSRSIDIHLDSMSQTRERAIAGVTSGLIGLGEQVTWRAWHFGIPFTMTSKIVAMEPPDSFVDEQIRGPFRRFRHEHRFTHDGLVTVMVDTIVFSSPLGPVGRAVDRFGLERYMARLISKRNGFLKHQAEGAP